MPKSKTLEEFIYDATLVHGLLYDYSKVNYINSHTKVIVICSVHGEFQIKPCSHTISKQGCAKCAGNVPYTTKEYIAKVAITFDDFYTYDKTMYTTAHNKITITCPIHGDFEQQAYVHMQGHHCPCCATDTVREKNRNKPDLWSYRGWEQAGNISSEFQGFSLYLVECWDKDKNEVFVKIGKTFTCISRRFRGNIPYEWKVCEQHFGSANYISELEAFLHRKFLSYKYTPSKQFNGSEECYILKLKDDFVIE